MAPGLIAGSLLGVAFASILERAVLQPLFGVFELLVAYLLWRGTSALIPAGAPTAPEAAGVGTAIGALSALLGIGGGTMTVPYLVWRNLDMRRAIGSSAACGVFIAVVAVFAFNMVTLDVDGEPITAVYWPAAFAIAWTSLIFAPLGARLTQVLPVTLLRKVFATLLLMVGLSMLWPH